MTRICSVYLEIPLFSTGKSVLQAASSPASAAGRARLRLASVFSLFTPGLSAPHCAGANSPHHQRLGYSCPGSATPDNPGPCFPARRVTPIVMFYSIVPSRSQKVEKYQVVPNQKVQQLIHNIPIQCDIPQVDLSRVWSSISMYGY